MRSTRALWVGAASVSGFLLSFGGIVAYWLSGFDGSGCEGDGCALELAAVITWGAVIALLIGATCAFVAFVLTSRRGKVVE